MYQKVSDIVLRKNDSLDREKILSDGINLQTFELEKIFKLFKDSQFDCNIDNFSRFSRIEFDVDASKIKLDTTQKAIRVEKCRFSYNYHEIRKTNDMQDIKLYTHLDDFIFISIYYKDNSLLMFTFSPKEV